MLSATLNNGIHMPYVGLGVFRMEDNDDTQQAIETALSLGYRHIDTAAIYGNEEAVRRAIENSGIPREQIFITTKLWNENQRTGKINEGIEESLRKLGTDYVDLYLIHWPVKEKFVHSWEAMQKIYESGKAKAIGVSNFKEHHLEAIEEVKGVTPAVNQIECHPYLTQEAVIEYCKKAGIVPEAWSPFAANKTNLFEEQVLIDIAEKYRRTPAQVVLRWNHQRGVVVIPKSSHPIRLQENLDIFNFELTEKEMAWVSGLNKDQRVGSDPDDFNF